MNESRAGASVTQLQGLLECSCCGYAYYGKKVSRASAKGKVPYAYYRCVGTDAYRFGGTRVCQNTQVRTDLLDDAVWNDVRELLRDPKLLRDEYERRLQLPAEDLSQREPLVRQYQQAQRTVSRLIDVYTEGVLDKHEFEPRLAQALRQRVERLRATTLEQFEPAGRPQREQLRASLACLDEFSDPDPQRPRPSRDWLTRREIIRTLVERVRIEQDQVRITYRIDFPFLPAKLARSEFCTFVGGVIGAALRCAASSRSSCIGPFLACDPARPFFNHCLKQQLEQP